MRSADLFDLSGKVAVITGGTGGIGVVFAEALCTAGASVVVASRNGDNAERVASALVAEGHQAIGVSVDVSSAQSAVAMAAVACDAFGGIDILVNNAAVMTDLPRYPLSTMPTEEWDRVMNVNLRGALVCAQAVVPSMESRGGGRIVNCLSAGAFKPGSVYNVSKYALHGLTVGLAAELGRRNINVNAIAPGLVDNDSAYVALPKDSPYRDAMAAAIPGKTSGPPEDLVGALLLLCSSAGDWINGQNISIDGGWVARL